MNWDDKTQSCQPRPPDPTLIALSGPSRTKALPAGPVLPFIATVAKGNELVVGARVTVTRAGAAAFTGTTDGAGRFAFSYVPPLQQPADVQLAATCDSCVNTARANIVVDAAVAETCSRRFGNPIEPATGEKQQDETDWQDASPHPLSITRHYRSQGVFRAGLGQSWSHRFAGQLLMPEGWRVVALGDGTMVPFEQAGGQWLAGNRIDRLEATSSGWRYTRAADDGRFDFDAQGRLIAITQRNGWAYTLGYDATGQLVEVRNAFGRRLQFAYDAAGRQASITPPDGLAVRYGHDGAGHLAQALYADGAGRAYHYEDPRWPNALTGVTDEAGLRESAFRYDAWGRAVATEHAGGALAFTAQYPPASNAGGALIAGHTVDPAWYRLEADVTDPLGAVLRNSWIGGDGTVRRVGASAPWPGLDWSSRALNGAMLPEAEFDFLGVRTDYAWDAARELKTATTRAANRSEAQTVRTEWHPAWRLPVRVQEPGRSTAYQYDAAGNLAQEAVTDTASGETRTRSFVYDARGLLEASTEPGGVTWRFTHDDQGRRTAVTDPLGQVTRYTHDAGGRMLTQTSPTGLLTAWTWDARGRLLTQTAAGETTVYAYTAAGQLASLTLPSGHRSQFLYDGAQRLIGAQDNRGASVAYTLDASGNRIREEVRDAGGAIALLASRAIDGLNRVAAVSGAAGQTTRLAYDANGEPVAQTDPLNQTTRRTLDGLRRETAVTFPDNAATAQRFSALDQLVQLTDPKGVATSYERNAFGEVMVETTPDTGVQRYERDGAGRVIAMVDAKGQRTKYAFDAAGRVIGIEDHAGAKSTLVYDSAGQLIEHVDASGGAQYERDALGRVVRKRQWVNDNPARPSSFATEYRWAAGELAGITYPSGLRVNYLRQAGRVTALEVQPSGRGQRILPWITALEHTALGSPKAWRWASGDSAARRFDADGRLMDNEFASFGYDAAGRVTGITQQLWASNAPRGNTRVALTWQAGYDSLDRVTSFVRDGAETRYSYDANSNRLSGIDKRASDTDLDGLYEELDFITTNSQQLDIDAASNRLLGLTQTLSRSKGGQLRNVATAPVRYGVDANGSITTDGLRRFEYDATGRLAAVKMFRQGEEQAVRYLHNALGQRVFKGEPQPTQAPPEQGATGGSFLDWLRRLVALLLQQAPGSTKLGTAYVYADGAIPPWALLGEYDNGSASGRGRTEYLWLPTEDGSAIPVGLYRGGELFAVHADHLGTPRLVTNAANQPVWQWPYSAFGDNPPSGVLRATRDPKAAITNQPRLLRATTPMEMNLRMPGQYFDEESGLFYNYHRSYSPAMGGRYTQGDPVGLHGGLNRYNYVEGNPISLVDPEGLMGRGSGGAAGGYRRGDGPGSPLGQAGAAAGSALDFAGSFANMMDATHWTGRAHNGWVNQDKYFHCIANCAAAQRGAGGHAMACRISDAREWFDQIVKGDPPAASVADQAANAYGRTQGAANANGSCQQLCGGYRPGGNFPF
ncbi:MAG TPA: RHS repeat-associated core domain-containing protein [Ramlibacter sp.]|nr:RHS repeat-associated core domain-containing protein [Ramlibacter sp.]